MRRRTKIWAVLLGAAVMLGAWGAWQHYSGRPRGNIAQALKTDVSTMDGLQLLDFVGYLKLDGATAPQLRTLFDHIKGRFDNMMVTEKLVLLLKARKIFEDDPNSPMMANARALMQEYWARELAEYMKAPPEERTKMIDARIDEMEVVENMQKVQDAAKSLFGQGGVVNPAEAQRVEKEIVRSIVDSMQTRPAAERAAASQYFMEMRERRIARGLPVLF